MPPSRMLFLLSMVVLAASFSGSASAQATPGTYHFAMGPNNPALPVMREYNNPNTILQFSLTRQDPGNDTLTAIMFWSWNWSAIDSAEVEAVEFWVDANSDGKVDAGDTLLAQADFLSTWWDVEFKGFSIDVSTSLMFLLTISLKPTAPTGGAVQYYLDNYSFTDYNGNAGWTAGSQVLMPDSPYGNYWYIVTNNFICLPSYAGIVLNAQFNVPAANAMRGSANHPVLQFSLGQDGNGYDPTVTAITVRGDNLANPNPHTAISSNITAIRLYREQNTPNGLVDQADQLVATGTLTGNGTASGFIYAFTGLDITITAGTPAVFLVTVDVINGAGNRLRMYVNKSDITNNGIALLGQGLTKVLDDPQTIIAAPAVGAYLAIVTGPSNTQVGANLAAPLGMRIEARDNLGVLFPAYSGPVTVTVESGPDTNFTPVSQTAAQASGGVATFQLTQMKTVGTYTLRFTAVPFNDAVSVSFTISHGTPYRITIIDQPQNGVAGVALPPPPVCHALDLYDNLCTTFNAQVTATLQTNPSGATLSNGIVAAVNGVVTYSNLQINRPGVGYSLIFGAAGLASSPQSSYFAVVLGPPSQIFMLQQPTTTAGGSIFAPPIRAEVRDAAGNAIPNYVGDMTVDIGNNPGGGTLSGTKVIAVSNGIAIFADLSINLAGVGYTLVFSIDNPVVNGSSAAFTIVVGAPARLAIIVQPTSTTGGLPFAPQPVVQVQDLGGNVISGDSGTVITAAITSGTGEAGGQLWGTTSMTVASGQADFSGLAVTKAGPNPYTLTFTADVGYTEAVSQSFTISVGPAARVGFSVQPAGASFGEVFLQQPIAQVQDLGGNLVSANPQRTISVSLDPSSGTAGATLSGTTSFLSVGGEVAFTNLSINFAGVDFILVASASGLVDGQTILFNVASEATQLGLSRQPAIGQIGLLLSVQPIVEARDPNGVLFTGDNFTLVTVEIAPGTGAPGASLSGNTSVYVVAGVAEFTNLQINTPGVGYRLKFTSYPALTPCFSEAFDVAGIAVKLKVTRQPTGATPGEFLSTQPRVEVADANNVRCIGENSVTVNAYITPATGTPHAILSGSNPVAVVNGIADFTDLSIDRPGIGYTLSFSSMPSMLPTTTNAFEIIGTVIPSHNSDNDIEGGVDGGTCSAAPGGAPWLLAAALALMSLATALHRRKA